MGEALFAVTFMVSLAVSPSASVTVNVSMYLAALVALAGTYRVGVAVSRWASEAVGVPTTCHL